MCHDTVLPIAIGFARLAVQRRGSHCVVCLFAAVCGFVFSYSISWAGGFWVVCSEFFSMRIKAFALSIVLAVMFGGGAVCNSFFLSLKSHLHHSAFLCFGALCTIATLFVCKSIPETKGKTLHEIQRLLAVSELKPKQPARRPPNDPKAPRTVASLLRFAPLEDAQDHDAALHEPHGEGLESHSVLSHAVGSISDESVSGGRQHDPAAAAADTVATVHEPATLCVFCRDNEIHRILPKLGVAVCCSLMRDALFLRWRVHARLRTHRPHKLERTHRMAQ
jgi:hypothetical protein